jgi:hypothetical protein
VPCEKKLTLHATSKQRILVFMFAMWILFVHLTLLSHEKLSISTYFKKKISFSFECQMSVTYMWKFQIVLGQWSYTESGSCKKPSDAVAFRIQLAASSEHLRHVCQCLYICSKQHCNPPCMTSFKVTWTSNVSLKWSPSFMDRNKNCKCVIRGVQWVGECYRPYSSFIYCIGTSQYFSTFLSGVDII